MEWHPLSSYEFRWLIECERSSLCFTPSKNTDSAEIEELADSSATGTYGNISLTLDGDQLDAVTVATSLNPAADNAENDRDR